MKSVYTGGEKVAEFENYNELRVGENKPAFIYEGNELVYPNPVKDGLVLWYDFSGRTNTDGQRGIAKDLSGNGNHGTLENFNYTPESGYDKNKLLFDGVDDYINTSMVATKDFAWSATLTPNKGDIDFMFMSGQPTSLYFRVERNRLSASVQGENTPTDYTRTNFVVLPDVTYHFLFTHHNGEYKIYANGEIVGESDKGNKESTYVLRGIGRYTLADLRAFPGAIHDVKAYNRFLTPEEIAHNYAIEKERFGIE